MNSKQRKLIALSAGGDNAELAEHGIGIEHINELMVRFSMRLLRDGHRLSFGGTLGNPKEPLTQHLIDTALTWLDDENTKESEVSNPETWPLINYSGWPYYTYIDDSTRAVQVGICDFQNVPPENVSREELTNLVENWKEDPVARRRNADSLTLMRIKSATEADLRIVWGGKVRGASGWMAGILEEIGFTLEYGKPLLLLGGFGGCSRIIADYLLQEDASWPSSMSLESTSDSERDNLLSAAEKKQLWERLEKVKSGLENFRKRLHSKKSINGIANEVLFQALSDCSPRQVVRLGCKLANSLR